MDIDVTHMVEDADEMFNLSGSRLEHGGNAGRFTWNNSIEYGKQRPLLTTDDERDEARRHFRSYGAWDDDEIAAWSEDDLQGIACQLVAGDIRELESAADYDAYVAGCEAGTYSGRLSRSDDGRWFFYFGD